MNLHIDGFMDTDLPQTKYADDSQIFTWNERIKHYSAEIDPNYVKSSYLTALNEYEITKELGIKNYFLVRKMIDEFELEEIQNMGSIWFDFFFKSRQSIDVSEINC
jgi:hypothetical protein